MRNPGDAHRSVPEVLRRSYPPGTALLFYSFHSLSLDVWLVTGKGIAAYQSSAVAPERLDQVITNLRGALGVESESAARAPRSRGLHAFKAAQVAKLSTEQATNDAGALLVPQTIAAKLADVSHLIVVPVLSLGTVPFALLQPLGPGRPLIDQMSISIAPSLFDLTQVSPEPDCWSSRQNGNPCTFTFGPSIVVGDPDLSADPEWLFPPLPGAREEAQAIAKLVGATAFTGRAASKAQVLPDVQEADLLYLATHGVADPSNPLDGSFVALSGSDKDGLRWTAREIQALHLRASLAVLSACQTGLGRAHDAGIIGLARAFQIAGVSHVVMSLWNVDDSATSQLMQRFIVELKACNDERCIPAEALRSATLSFKKDHPEPRLWAPFVLFGTPR